MSTKTDRLNRLRKILQKTIQKIASEDAIKKEHFQLDLVPPAPGNPHLQHDTMVEKGLSKEAVKYPTFHRYCNQYPFDSNVVRVRGVPYINASYIKIPLWNDTPIVTMGPMCSEDMKFKCPDTRIHFWQMVWELDLEMVVMLCKIQTGFTGCSRYFPENTDHSETYGSISIELNKKTDFEGFCIRELTLRDVKSGRVKTIRHFHFLLWPNYGVPSGVEELSNFVKEVQSYAALFDKEVKMVIHCSGGLGRSGTFLTTLLMYQALYDYVNGIDLPFSKTRINICISNKKKEIVLQHIIWNMRLQRHPWMVEGIDQHLLAYKTLVKLIENMTNES